MIKSATLKASLTCSYAFVIRGRVKGTALGSTSRIIFQHIHIYRCATQEKWVTFRSWLRLRCRGDHLCWSWFGGRMKKKNESVPTPIKIPKFVSPTAVPRNPMASGRLSQVFSDQTNHKFGFDIRGNASDKPPEINYTTRRY